MDTESSAKSSVPTADQSDTFVQMDAGDNTQIDQEVKDLFQKWGMSEPKFYVYNTPKRSMNKVGANRQNQNALSGNFSTFAFNLTNK
jgi:hypothetical protein